MNPLKFEPETVWLTELDLPATARAILEGLDNAGRFHPEVGTGAICPQTAEPYLTLAFGADGQFPKAEGTGATIFNTSEQAWNLWALGFQDWTRRHRGMIYWRGVPQLCKAQSIWGVGFYVWARAYVALDDPSPGG